MTDVARGRGVEPRARDEGIDIARALAVAAMVLWHAVDAWCEPAARSSAWFPAIRLVGSTALPGFLLLAGVGLALAVEAAERRGVPWQRVRWSLVRRGLLLVVAGYAFNAAQALVDGAPSIEAVARADVLQGIGLSLALVTIVHVRLPHPDRPRRADVDSGLVALALGALVVAPFVGLVSQQVGGAIRPLVALLAYVPGFARAPVVPVVAIVAAGALLATVAREAQRSWPALVAIGAVSVGVTVVARVGCDATVSALGGALTPAHPAVVLNAIDGSARAVTLIALGGLLAWVPLRRLRGVLARVGRASLFAYVVHIPFCYGRLGGPLAHRLSLPLSVAAASTLFALVTIAVFAKDALAARRAQVEPATER